MENGNVYFSAFVWGKFHVNIVESLLHDLGIAMTTALVLLVLKPQGLNLNLKADYFGRKGKMRLQGNFYKIVKMSSPPKKWKSWRELFTSVIYCMSHTELRHRPTGAVTPQVGATPTPTPTPVHPGSGLRPGSPSLGGRAASTPHLPRPTPGMGRGHMAPGSVQRNMATQHGTVWCVTI